MKIEDLDFIVSHFRTQRLDFPRKIMTANTKGQIVAQSIDEAFKQYEDAGFRDCRINAYPDYTEWAGIDKVTPSFLFIDLDYEYVKKRKTDPEVIPFDERKKRTDFVLHNTLTRMRDYLGTDCRPTVLETGGGYHIYQPCYMNDYSMRFIDINEFATLEPELESKNVTNEFLAFAEYFFTANNSDPNHHPKVKSSLLRIPASINVKRKHWVGIKQSWNGIPVDIKWILKHFLDYLKGYIKEEKARMEQIHRVQDLMRKRARELGKTEEIDWIEKLLSTPLNDGRKYAVWRIFVPYLANVRNETSDNIRAKIQAWFDLCNRDFPNNQIDKATRDYLTRSIKRVGTYLPVSRAKIKEENPYIFGIVTLS